MKTLHTLTGTKNKAVNALVLITLLFIAFSIVALVTACATNPNLIANASF